MVSTCGTSNEHFADLCFFASNVVLSDKSIKILMHILDAIILILSAGFAFPVLQLFHLQVRNFLAG